MHDANQNDDQVMEFFNASLDDSQKDAVRFVLTTKNVISVIHGPPGIIIFMVVRGVFRFFSNICVRVFAKLVNGSLSLIIFAESSFVDVWRWPKYTSVAEKYPRCFRCSILNPREMCEVFLAKF